MLQETKAAAGMQCIKEGSGPNKLQKTEKARYPLQGSILHLSRSFLPCGSVVTMVVYVHAPKELSKREILPVLTSLPFSPVTVETDLLQCESSSFPDLVLWENPASLALQPVTEIEYSPAT